MFFPFLQGRLLGRVDAYFSSFRRCNYPRVNPQGVVEIVEECGRYARLVYTLNLLFSLSCSSNLTRDRLLCIRASVSSEVRTSGCCSRVFDGNGNFIHTEWSTRRVLVFSRGWDVFVGERRVGFYSAVSSFSIRSDILQVLDYGFMFGGEVCLFGYRRNGSVCWR